MPQRLLAAAMGQPLVERLVLLVGHLGLRLDPDRLLLVQGLVGQQDGMRDEGRVSPHNQLQPIGVEKLVQPLLQVQPDFGPARHIPFGRGNGEPARAIRLPPPGSLFLVAAGHHFDPVGQHERRVEANPELPDQRQVGSSLPRGGAGGQLLEEFLRTAVSDGPEVLNQLGLRQPDAVVTDDQHAALWLRLEHDLQRVIGPQLGRGELNVSPLVERVGGVGNELAEGDLVVLIQRVRQDVQELLDFRLEREFLGSRHRGNLRAEVGC